MAHFPLPENMFTKANHRLPAYLTKTKVPFKVVRLPPLV